LTKDELRGYGIPAFANGGIVYMKNGGLPFFKGASQNQTAIPKTPGVTIPQEETEAKVRYEMDDKGNTVKITEKTITVKGQPRVVEDREIIKKADTSTRKLPQLRGKTPDKETSLESVMETEKEFFDRQLENLKDKDKEEKSSPEGPIVPKAKVTPEREKRDTLADLVKQRSELYKKLLGDPKEMMKQQGFLQLAQFGLNLASARGGNLAEKIAKSAKDPLEAFAALAREAAKDERAIEVAAIEAGESQLARQEEREAKMGSIEESAKYLLEVGLAEEEGEAAQMVLDLQTAKAGDTISDKFSAGFNDAVKADPTGKGGLKALVNGAISANGYVPKNVLVAAPVTEDEQGFGIDMNALEPDTMYSFKDAETGEVSVFSLDPKDNSKIKTYNFEVF
jgi:hypothetical protein